MKMREKENDNKLSTSNKNLSRNYSIYSIMEKDESSNYSMMNEKGSNKHLNIDNSIKKENNIAYGPLKSSKRISVQHHIPSLFNEYENQNYFY